MWGGGGWGESRSDAPVCSHSTQGSCVRGERSGLEVWRECSGLRQVES